jgi:thioester reductase-like protein
VEAELIMNLYLVQGVVYSTPYMGDTQVDNVTRLVRAEDEMAAMAKFEDYWDKKSKPYSHSYQAMVESCTGVIE